MRQLKKRWSRTCRNNRKTRKNNSLSLCDEELWRAHKAGRSWIGLRLFLRLCLRIDCLWSLCIPSLLLPLLSFFPPCFFFLFFTSEMPVGQGSVRWSSPFSSESELWHRDESLCCILVSKETPHLSSNSANKVLPSSSHCPLLPPPSLPCCLAPLFQGNRRCREKKTSDFAASHFYWLRAFQRSAPIRGWRAAPPRSRRKLLFFFGGHLVAK